MMFDEIELPEGCIPLGFVAVVKALDPEGSLTLFHIQSTDLTSWEVVGMVKAAQLNAEEVLVVAGAGEVDDE